MSALEIAAFVLACNLAGLGLWILIAASVLRTPARQFTHGHWTKAGRVVLAVCGTAQVHHLFVPWGAGLIALGWRRARTRQRVSLAPGDPYAPDPKGPQ